MRQNYYTKIVSRAKAGTMIVRVYYANRRAPKYQEGGLVAVSDGREIFAFPRGMASWRSASSVGPKVRIPVESTWGLELLAAHHEPCPYTGELPLEGRCFRTGYRFSVRGRTHQRTTLDCGACGYHDVMIGRYACGHPSGYSVLVTKQPYATLVGGVGFDFDGKACLVPSIAPGELAVIRFQGEVHPDYLERHFVYDLWDGCGSMAVLSRGF